MGYDLREYTYLTLLGLATLIGLINFRKLDKGGKVFCLLLCLSVISEATTFFLARRTGNNMIVYHIYSPIEFFMISYYFNITIDTFRRKSIGIYIGIVGIIVSIINSVFIQPVTTFNTYYLLFEGLCFISMSLFSFYQIMLKDNYASPLKDPHFRISFLLLFFWCVTFITWGVFELVATHTGSYVIGVILWIANVIFYLGIAIVFLLYKRKPVVSEHA